MRAGVAPRIAARPVATRLARKAVVQDGAQVAGHLGAVPRHEEAARREQASTSRQGAGDQRDAAGSASNTRIVGMPGRAST